MWYLLKKYPSYDIFLLASMAMFMGYNLGTTFLIDVIKNLGGNNFHYGLAEFVMAIAEVPSAILFLKLRKKIRVEFFLVCCSIFMLLKMPAIAQYCYMHDKIGNNVLFQHGRKNMFSRIFRHPNNHTGLSISTKPPSSAKRSVTCAASARMP